MKTRVIAGAVAPMTCTAIAILERRTEPARPNARDATVRSEGADREVLLMPLPAGEGSAGSPPEPSGARRAAAIDVVGNGPEDAADSTALPGPAQWAERYRGSSSAQLFREGRALNRAYTRLASEASREHMGDESRRVYVQQPIDESDWEGVICAVDSHSPSESGDRGAFRIRLRREEHPDIYAMRDETEWLFEESRKRQMSRGR